MDPHRISADGAYMGNTLRAGGQQRIPRPDTWQIGNVAPWLGVDTEPLLSLDTVTRRLASHSAQVAAIDSAPQARASAVLVALYQGDEGVEVVLTKRASHLKNHKGEISFPGGRVEPDETAREAALREAEEEVGLSVSDVTLVGELDHLLTIVSQSYIVPLVGILKTRPILVASPNEVDRILHVPLCDLVRPDTFQEEQWSTNIGNFTISLFHLDDETIWGATARVLTQMLRLSLNL